MRYPVDESTRFTGIACIAARSTPPGTIKSGIDLGSNGAGERPIHRWQKQMHTDKSVSGEWFDGVGRVSPGLPGKSWGRSDITRFGSLSQLLAWCGLEGREEQRTRNLP
jgi:hypothetical protein